MNENKELEERIEKANKNARTFGKLWLVALALMLLSVFDKTSPTWFIDACLIIKSVGIVFMCIATYNFIQAIKINKKTPE